MPFLTLNCPFDHRSVLHSGYTKPDHAHTEDNSQFPFSPGAQVWTIVGTVAVFVGEMFFDTVCKSSKLSQLKVFNESYFVS